MPTENTSLKNTAPAGDSNTTNEMVMGKINNYQRTFLIVGGSLLALLVLIAVAGTSSIQHLQSSVYEITEGAVTLQDYQGDSANFDFGATEIDEGGCRMCGSGGRFKKCCNPCRCRRGVCKNGVNGGMCNSSF